MTTFDITGWAVDLMDRLGGPGAGLAIALENLFPPLPSEVLLPIAGLTASQGRMGLAEAVLWTTAGSVAGAAVLYWLAAAFGRDRLLAVAVRLPLVRREDVERPRPGSRGTAARRCSWAAWCRWSAAWSLVRARPAAPGPERPLRTTRAMSAGPRFVTGWLRLVAGVGAGGARWLTSLDRRRVAWLGRTAVTGDGVPAGRAGRYLALRVPVGLFGGGIVAVFLWGAGTAAGVAGLWLRGHEVDGLRPTPALVAYFLGAGATLMFLNLAGVAAVHRLEERWAAGVLGGGARERYERRIAELAHARAEVVTAVDDERRRIERDLHDGVQQRLVGLGMLLGRARRAGDRAALDTLLAQAHEEAAATLRELREVAWRVYPTALDDGGLPAALETVAERSQVTVSLGVELPERPAATVEAAAYFVVCESVTNAAKHSGADVVDVRVRRAGDDLFVEVRDDGAGGADPDGGGLAGPARRVHALDGALTVQRPAGGPTVVSAVLPCA